MGEPVRREKLVKGLSSGFLSAILPAGRRAVAITIDNTGSTTAGGFIFPQDRVDVVRTTHEESKTPSVGNDTFVSETILRNVRVLAIGPNVQEKKWPDRRGRIHRHARTDPRPSRSHHPGTAQRAIVAGPSARCSMPTKPSRRKPK